MTHLGIPRQSRMAYSGCGQQLGRVGGRICKGCHCALHVGQLHLYPVLALDQDQRRVVAGSPFPGNAIG